MDPDEIKYMPTKGLKIEEGAEELFHSSLMRPYIEAAEALLQNKDASSVIADIAAELPALEPGAMCYVMSKRQYLSDQGMSWHPHLMFFVPGEAAKSWGADLAGSPVLAADDPEERVTIMMVPVGTWSDRTLAPPMAH